MYYAAAFALFCMVCTVFAFTRHPVWGLYFYLGTTYVFPPSRWWGYVFGDLRWALLAASVTALAVLAHRGKLQDKPLWLGHAPVVMLILFNVWMWIQTPWALDLSDHLNGSIEFSKCLLALWFVYRVLDSKERIRDLMLGHVLGCGLLGIYARYAGREGDRLDGVGGPNIDDSNTLGMYLATAAVMGVALVMTQKGGRRIASLIALPLILNGFVLANSRGSFLGIVAGMLVLSLCMASQYRRLFWSMALVGAIGLAVIVDKVFIERMFTIQDVASESDEADASARSRLVIAKAQLEMFIDHPMGSGRRGTAVLSPQYMESQWLTGDADSMARSSHNTFLSALAEQGLPGGLIYGCLTLWVVSAALRVRRLNLRKIDPELVTMGASLAAGLIVVLVAGMTADYLVKEVQFWLYAALVSVFWLTETRTQSEHVEQPAAEPRRAAA